MTWFRNAADQGFAGAQFNLGIMVVRGLGVAQDESLALTWLSALEEIAMNMEPDDGCLSVWDLDDDVSIVAFTAQGIENLKELLDDLDP